MGELLYKDITEKIIGCAMKVHSYFVSLIEGILADCTDGRIIV